MKTMSALLVHRKYRVPFSFRMKQKHGYALVSEKLIDNILLLFALVKRSK